MFVNYAATVGSSFEPDPTEPIMESIFQQYERVLVESLITSFGLDFLVQDQHGGDVDTIHNVRQIGRDEQMAYKDLENKQAYDQRGQYDAAKYHHHPQYIAKNREVSAQKQAGTLFDIYTGQRIAPDGKSDLDHVVSAKEIHHDPGRVLADLSGEDLANSRENLYATNPHTNRTKKADLMDDFLKKHGDEYTDEQQDNMRRVDAASRKAYESKLARAYYTSPKFALSLAKSAGKVSIQMGTRQALGFVFAEMWFAVKEEFQRISGSFHLGEFLKALGHGIRKGFERAKEKYQELFSRFLNGAIAGALASLTTTICNIFFTTAKNVVRIIRQSYASIVEAAKVLFFNPENYTFGERMRAVIKILATGASIAVGVIVGDAIAKTPVGMIPVLGDIIQTFCNTFVTGIMSCTLLYFLDRSEIMQKLFKALDSIHTIETEIDYYRRQADYFEHYAAELMEIDLEQFRKETAFYKNAAQALNHAKDEQELNHVLRQVANQIGMRLPWQDHESLDDFMSDRNAQLVFE